MLPPYIRAAVPTHIEMKKQDSRNVTVCKFNSTKYVLDRYNPPIGIIASVDFNFSGAVCSKATTTRLVGLVCAPFGHTLKDDTGVRIPGYSCLQLSMELDD